MVGQCGGLHPLIKAVLGGEVRREKFAVESARRYLRRVLTSYEHD